MSRVSRANAASVNLTHPLVVSADLTRQVLVSLHKCMAVLDGERACGLRPPSGWLRQERSG